MIDFNRVILFLVEITIKTGALQTSFRSAIGGIRLSEQDAKPCFRASAHLNQELRVDELRGANKNPVRWNPLRQGRTETTWSVKG